MKQTKKLLIPLLLASLAMGAAGCAGGTSGKANGGSDNTPKGNDISGGKNGEAAAEASFDLTIHMHYWDYVAFDDNWPVFKEAAKKTNINLKGTASKTATDSYEIFNLMLTSGKLADIVVGTKPQFHQFGVEGAFIPLGELIEKHAPNLNRYLQEHPEVAKSIKAPDGQIYYIPFLPDGKAAQGWFIRKDWLEALKLDVPNSVEDLYNVLTAFKTMNPNGDAAKQEVPYFTRNGTVADMVVLWGARPSWMVENNKVVWGPTQPAFKTAVVNLAKWYKEGLIDKEVFTRGGKAREILLGDNLGGVTHDWFASTALYNESVKEQVPGIQFVPMAPPADSNGERIELSSRDEVALSGWAISSDNKHPIETIRYFDYWFTEEGRRLANFGVEGITYDLVDGQPVFKDEILHSGGSVVSKLNEYGAQLEFGFKQDFEYEKQWMNELALQGAEMYMDNNYFAEKFPALTFTLEEQKQLDQIQAAVDSYFAESLQKWVLGVEDVEQTFERYLTTLDSMGMGKLTKIYQDAFDRYNQ
ncbi:hypothetical protein [Paenibacillus sp. GCM10027626]|uniref:hypothetical protein n=1 Tax=Paenibacillus sp. GCM10027626 TaxID=3273411 RepID=UPI0036396861